MKNFIKKFSDFVENKIAPPLIKLSENPFLLAIRDGAMAAMPFFVIGSMALLICCLPIKGWDAIIGPYFGIIFQLFSMTMGIVSLYACAAIGYNLAKRRNFDPMTGVLASLMFFLYLTAPMTEGGLPTRYLDATGFMMAILAPIIAVELCRFFVKKGIVVKMPPGVPPGIARPFESLVPLTILLLLAWLIGSVFGIDVPGLVVWALSPLSKVTDSIAGVLTMNFAEQSLWFVGIHGASIVETSIMEPYMAQFVAANQSAMLAGKELPHIFTPPFGDYYMTIGGCGCTLALPFMLLKAKSKRLRRIAQLAIIPAIFGINEPLLFGIPLVLNPITLIPFLCAGAVTGVIAYGATALGLVNKAFMMLTWSTPAPIYAFLSTGGDWRAVALSLGLAALAGLMYYPFLRIHDRQLAAEEAMLEASERIDALSQ